MNFIMCGFPSSYKVLNPMRGTAQSRASIFNVHYSPLGLELLTDGNKHKTKVIIGVVKDKGAKFLYCLRREAPQSHSPE